MKKELQFDRKKSWGLRLSTQGDNVCKARDREGEPWYDKQRGIRLEMWVGNELQKV